MPKQANTMGDIRRITHERLGVELNTIKPSSRFLEDLGASSQSITALMQDFQDRLGVHIPGADLEALTTVKAVADYLDAHRTT